MKKLLQKIKSFDWGVLLYAVLFVIAGVLLIAFPEDGLPSAILVISVITLLYAVYVAVSSLVGKKRDFKFFLNLLGAVAALFCGLFLLIKRNDDAVKLLAFFVGAMVVIDGSFKLHTAVTAKEYKNAAWWVLLVLSLLTIVGGFFMVKRPPDAVKICSVILGLLMIVDGIQNGFITFYAPAIENRLKRAAVEENADEAEKEKAAANEKTAKKAAKAERKAKRKADKSNHDDEVATLPLDHDEYPIPADSDENPDTVTPDSDRSDVDAPHETSSSDDVKTVTAEETKISDSRTAPDAEPVDSIEIVVEPNEEK